MKNMQIPSRRTFQIQISEQGTTTNVKHTINEILSAKDNGDDFEYKYALNYELDKVLDLKVGESMYFSPNRDNDLAKGIITRLK